MWWVWQRGLVGNPMRFLGTVQAADEQSAISAGRSAYGHDVYVVPVSQEV